MVAFMIIMDNLVNKEYRLSVEGVHDILRVCVCVCVHVLCVCMCVVCVCVCVCVCVYVCGRRGVEEWPWG